MENRMPAPRAAARRVTPDDDRGHLSNECPQAAALDRQTAEMALWREAIFGDHGAWDTTMKPALLVIVSFGERLDALCKWLKGKWPWAAMIAYLVISRTINASPEEVPKLLQALSQIVQTASGQ